MAVTVVLGASLTREAIPELCAWVRDRLAATPGPGVVACDVRAVDRPDAVVLDALARLQLTVRRHGSELRLRGVGPALRGLLAVIGFDEALGLVELAGDDQPPREPPIGRSARPPAAASVEMGRQAEEGEEAVGVEEGVEADDPVA